MNWTINIHTAAGREFELTVKADTDLDALAKAMVVYRNDEDRLADDTIHMIHIGSPSQ